MIFKRSIFILLCLFITFSSFGCIGLLSDIISDEAPQINEGKEPAILEVKGQENQNPSNPGTLELDDPSQTDHVDDSRDLDFHDLVTLDMSSADAFIADVQRVYDVKLTDERGYLSGSDGALLMRELNHTLSLFTPDFIRVLVEEYGYYNAGFSIALEGPSSTEFGLTEWDRDLKITLHYDRDPEENGISAAVLAHELAHAVHFIIEEYLGEARSESELRYFNGEFDYVEDDYDHVWDPDIHGRFFAYDYGMYDYYEDFATVIEMLIAFPDDMLERFSDAQHEALLRKTIYLRDIMYFYISDTCFPLFSPLYEAEALWDARAA